jgi:hypothetical protein
MPFDQYKIIHFTDAYQYIFKEAIRDTIKTDTTRTDTSIIRQDTSIQGDTSQQPSLEIPGDTAEEQIQTLQPAAGDTERIDSLMKQDEIRAESLKEKEKAEQKEVVIRKPTAEKKPGTDTALELYEIFGVTKLPISDRLKSDPTQENFLYNIPAVKPSESLNAKDIYIEVKAAAQQEVVNQTKIQQQEKSISSGYDWVTFTLIAILLLIGWTRLFFKKYFVSLIKSFQSYNYAYSLFLEKNSLTARASLILNFTFFITTGLFLFQTLHYYGYTLPLSHAFQQFLFLSAFSLAWYIWNYLMTEFTGFVFLREQSFLEYLHNYNIYRKILGVILFPLVFILAYISPEYKPIFIIMGAALFGIVYFTHILRGLQIFMKKKVSIYYLILYLCALEILPLVVLYEVFIREL